MAQKIKKGFFKFLPASMAVLMVLAISFGVWQSLPVGSSLAAAPAGSMTATALLMKGNQTKAINAITIVDAGAEISALNDIKVLIPATFVDTTWDAADTTATIDTTGNTTGAVSTTVSYATTNYANDTLVLDVTADFTAGDQVIVGGLSFISANPGTNNSSALNYAVDGATFSAGSSATLSVDTVAPTVSVSCISVTGAFGTGGAFKNGDTPTLQWRNDNPGSGCTDNNTDIASVSFNGASFKAGDIALAGGNAANIWTASLSGAMDAQDDINNNISVSATDNAGNVTTVAGTNNYTIDTNIPTVTGANVFVTGATGTAGAFKFGDSPVLTWDVTTEGETDTITSATFNGNSFAIGAGARIGFLGGGLWTATLVGAIDSQDDVGNTITVTVLDDVGNTSGAVTSAVGYVIDTIVPVVTAANISAIGATGTAGAFKNGDTVTMRWDVTTEGEADTLASVTFNGTSFKAGDTARVGVLGAGIYSIGLSGAMDSQDDTNNNISVTVTDTAGNATTTSGTNNYSIDTIVPTVTGANVTVTGATGTAGAFKFGNTPVLTWDVTTEGESDTLASVNFDGSNFRAVDGSRAGSLGGGLWTASLSGAMDSQDDIANTITSTVVDNAGNSTGPVTSAVGYVIDTIVPVVTAANISASGATGTGGAFKNGDTVSMRWDVTTEGEADTLASVTFNGTSFKAGDTARVGVLGAGIYSVGLSGAMDSQDDATNNISATVTDTAGNVTTTAGTNDYTIDTILPTITGQRYESSLENGNVNAATVTFSENVNWTGLNNSQFSITPNALTGFGVGISGWGGNNTSTLNFTWSGSTNQISGTSGVQPTLKYTQEPIAVADRVKDDVGNDLATTADLAMADNAKPVIVSHTPASNEENVLVDTAVVYNFSEPMVTTFNHGTQFSSAPNPGGWGAVWSNGNKTVTLTHTSFLYGSSYSLTNSVANILAASGLVTDLATAGNWSFSTMAAGRIGGGSSATPTASFMINSGATETMNSQVSLNISGANATEMLIGNDVNFIGSNWEPLTSTKTWSLPAGLGNKTVYLAVRNASLTVSTIYSQSINVLEKAVEPTIDVNASSLATDITAAKADGAEKILATVTVKMNNGAPAVGKTVVLESSRAVEDKVNAINAITDSAGVAKFEVTSTFSGVSTLKASVDGFSIENTIAVQFTSAVVNPEVPNVNLVNLEVGDLITCPANGPAVYYYGADGQRHSFASATIYYTYYTDFSNIKNISAEQMAGIPLGGNAKVRPGTWMVKIQSDNKVYAVTPGGVLRWVMTEQIAKDLYGTTWNKKIIDIPSSFFQDYTIGAPIETSSHPSASLIQYQGSSTIYYISNGVKRMVVNMSAFNANRFQDRFKQVVSTSLVYSDGTNVTGKEDSITEVVY